MEGATSSILIVVMVAITFPLAVVVHALWHIARQVPILERET
jgi:hypothetical protein